MDQAKVKEEERKEEKKETSKEKERARAGFAPLVKGLDELMEGGVPQGSWVSIYGTAGAYKTLHSLAFCIAGLMRGERCVFVSTEMNFSQIKGQLASLGWDEHLKTVHGTMFTTKILEQDYGNYEFVLIDTDSLYFWARKLNVAVREEKKKKSYWYTNINVLAHAIITALGAVGVVEREKEDITLEEIEYSRLRDGLFEKESKWRFFTIDKSLTARVVIDSFSPYVEAYGFNRSGSLMTWLKMRLALPNVTYVIVNHTSKMTEEELGAAIAHVVDGRIRLLRVEEGEEQRVKGAITKMRETNHDTKLHVVSVDREKNKSVLKWQ